MRKVKTRELALQEISYVMGLLDSIRMSENGGIDKSLFDIMVGKLESALHALNEEGLDT